MRASSWHATSNLVLGFARVGLIAPGWRIDARKMTPEPKKPVQGLQRNGTVLTQFKSSRPDLIVATARRQSRRWAFFLGIGPLLREYDRVQIPPLADRVFFEDRRKSL
jgi:hypothetical protein